MNNHSEPRTFLAGRVTLHAGDCREVLRDMADNSVDSVCTDPPYHLTSIVKRFSKMGDKKLTMGGVNPFQRTARGFMQKEWDGGDIAFQTELWAEVLRVLKPGGYIMAFSGCRTYHHMACAIEDAGFITHPFFAWATGQGFPKAHNVSKQIDKAAGARRKVVGKEIYRKSSTAHENHSINMGAMNDGRCSREWDITAPATDAAREWDGWFYGTQSLKPSIEPVYFGQKPFERGLNGAQNVMKWGVGAINVGACKVGNDIETCNTLGVDKFANMYSGGKMVPKTGNTEHVGRWPANLIHDGSDEVLACFPETVPFSKQVIDHPPGNNSLSKGCDSPYVSQRNADNGGSSARFFASFPQDDYSGPSAKHYVGADLKNRSKTNENIGDSGSSARFFASFPQEERAGPGGRATPRKIGTSTPIHGVRSTVDYPDDGSAARYFASFPQEEKRIFYTSNADSDDRLGSKHPTVKPLDLIHYLVRLITPKNGICLDLFAGTGTTGEACFREGFRAILIEREPEYIADIERRMSLVMEGPVTRACRYEGARAAAG